MTEIVRASRGMFSRTRDKVFDSFEVLCLHCSSLKENSVERLISPEGLIPTVLDDGQIGMSIGCAGQFRLNDWSFGQLCVLAGVDKAWVNDLSPRSASIALNDNFSRRVDRMLRVLTNGNQIRAIQAADCPRLYNSEFLDMVRELWFNGCAGLYCGEQDVSCFLTNSIIRVDVGKETFVPGFFASNSEVGGRNANISIFWHHIGAKNPIIWSLDQVMWEMRHLMNAAGDWDRLHDRFAQMTKAAEAVSSKLPTQVLSV